MIYKIHNDFSPVVCPPKVVIDKEVTKIVAYSGNRGEIYYGVDLKETENFLTFKTLLFGEEITIGKRFIFSMVQKRFVGVDYDMTANHNFGSIKHCYYTFRFDDDFQIVSDNIHIEDKEKPHMVGIYYGDNLDTLLLHE